MTNLRRWSAATLLTLAMLLGTIVPPANALSPLEKTAGAAQEPAAPIADGTIDPTPATPSPTGGPGSTSTAAPTPAPTTTSSAGTEPLATPEAALPTPLEAQAAIPGADAIEAEWQRLDGPSGFLGNAVSNVECGLAQGGCRRQFVSGKIHWTADSGAVATTGPIAATWMEHQEAVGRLGYPTESQSCMSGAHCQQSFQSGYIVSTPGTGTFAVYVPYAQVWSDFGAAGGRLGRPIGAESCDGSGAGCSQRFQGGSVVWASGHGTSAIYEPYFGIWAANGLGAGRLGYPISSEACTASGSGCIQQFQRGYLTWVPGAGTSILDGIYATVWASQGREYGRLGFPLAGEVCGLVRSGCYRAFTGGAIYWNAGNGAFPVFGGYEQMWSKYGREAGRLGYPVSAEQCGLSGPGCVQSFQGGYVYWAAGIGFHSVYGIYAQVWGSKRAQDGAMGYPVDEESCQSNSCVQRFEGGTIQWTAGRGASLRYSEWGYCRSLNVGASKYTSGGANRVAFAVSQGYGTTPITFTNCVKSGGKYVHDWTVGGYAGESGFAPPGVATGPTTGKYSPTGSFSITQAFGLGNPGTALPYQTLNQYSRWGGRLNANYNKYFESSADVFPDENMWYFATRPSGDYRQGAVINYNRPPDSDIVMNAGFAIFLHANSVPTWGCISLSESNVVRFLQGAGYGDRLIMGVSHDIFE